MTHTRLDESVDLIIASPLGDLEALWSTTREMIRVLKPSGSIWVNLGDSLMGWRYAIGCIDDLGLILRAEVIWGNPGDDPSVV